MSALFNQSIIWTLLPVGMTELKADVPAADDLPAWKAGVYFDFSVIVSPRLESTTSSSIPLYTFPDWQKDPNKNTGRSWPETLQSLMPKLTLEVPGLGAPGKYHARQAPTVAGQLFGSQRPSVALWEEMFPNAGANPTTVKPFLFKDVSGRRLRSAPVGAIADAVAEMYGYHGMQSPTAFPTYDSLLPTFGRLGFNDTPKPPTGSVGVTVHSGAQRLAMYNRLLHEELNGRGEIHAVTDQLEDLVKSSLGSAAPPGAARAIAFLQAFQYMNRPKAQVLDANVKDNSDWDFHQIVGAAASLPSLMRVLGLVLDLRAGPISPDAAHPTAVETKLKAANANKKLLSVPVQIAFDGQQLTWKPTPTPPVAPTNNKTYNVRPHTMCLADFGIFRAKPEKVTDHFERMLKLGDGKLFRYISLDHINAALKARQLGDNIGRSRVEGKKVTPSAADRFSLPSLRTGGLAISRTNRATQMANILKRQTDTLQKGYFKGGPAAPLYEEDITRGYRFDVFSKQIATRWFSLMWRQGPLTIGGADPFTVLEEDTIVPNTATAGPDDGTKDFYLSEIISRWDGWSLAVQRIGTPFQQHPDSAHAGPQLEYNVMTDWSVPGTKDQGGLTNLPANLDADKLPPLRFGVNYQMRARLVDLAGNSVSVANAPKEGIAVTANLQHKRYEPAPAPRMLLVGAPQPGASEEVMVVRSESGADQSNGGIDTGTATRVIVPASTSVFMAEQHGALDVPVGSAKEMDSSAARYADLAARDGTSLLNHAKGTVNPSAVHSQTNPFIYPGFFTINYLPEVIGKIALVRGLPVNDDKKTTAQIPFLNGADWPKLVNGRVVLSKAAPGAKNDWSVNTDVVGTDGYPNPLPDPGPGPTTGGSITVSELDLQLGVGDMITCLLNAEISLPVLNIMEMWDLVQAQAAKHGRTSAEILTLRNQILAGEHWMFTPWRRVTFVHAVRTPLADPQLFLKPTKTVIGQTYAEFEGTRRIAEGTVLFSRKSTARIDVNATWTMPIDTGLNDLTPATGTFSTIQNSDFSGPVFSLDIARVGEGAIPDTNTASVLTTPDAENFTEIHQFSDTKFRAVNYQATATSYYIEYFREQLTIPTTSNDPVTELRTGGPFTPGVAFEPETVKLELVGITPHNEFDPLGSGALLSDDQVVVRPLVEAPPGTDPDIAAPTPGDFVVIPNTANPTQSQIAILTNSTVTAAAVDGPVKSVVMSYVGPTIHTYSHPVADHTTAATMLVPNSKRPDAPDPLYVVPIMSRSENNGDPTNISWTRNAVRVYLNRPWWSSGDLERLGVVCWHQTSKTGAVPPDSLLPYVSVWGFDPAQKSRFTLTSKTKQPNPSCFPFATASNSNNFLTIEETSAKVDVAGHNVQYDATRDLWYADIQVAAPGGGELGSYMPFIRFALARYQPHSIDGAHLSKIVTVDYAQVAPNRHVTVVNKGGNGYAVTVTGVGPTQGGGVAKGGNNISVTVETKADHIGDDSLAWKPFTLPGVGVETIELSAKYSDTDHVTWSGSINPTGLGGAEARLTISEFELWSGHERLVWSDSIPLLPT